MGFLSSRASRIKASPSNLAAQRGRELQAAGARHRQPRPGRARLSHPGPHHRSRVPRDARRPDALHHRGRHPGTQGRGDRQIRARERPRVQDRKHHRRQRRQAGDLQRADGHARRGRRGDHPGALLGVLPGHGAVRRRHAGARGDASAGRSQDHGGGARSSDHAAHQVADPQFAVEPLRRHLLGGRTERRSRRCSSATRTCG